MSDHSFNIFIAEKYSINIAIFINNMIFWTRTNASDNRNFHDGRYWTYGTPEFYAKYFPYFKPRLIKDILARCIENGLLLKGNFNKNNYDQTSWYSLSDSALLELNLDRTCLRPQQNPIVRKTSNGSDVKRPMDRTDYVQPIPVTKPDTKTDTNSEGDNSPTHTIISFPSKKELQAKYSHDNQETQTFFKTKFNAYAITYDELFNQCKVHYESKNQWVTIKKWKLWVEREKLENYTKANINKQKAPDNETDTQRQDRHFITNEITKELTRKGYTSKLLQERPELREKYAQYAKG